MRMRIFSILRPSRLLFIGLQCVMSLNPSDTLRRGSVSMLALKIRPQRGVAVRPTLTMDTISLVQVKSQAPEAPNPPPLLRLRLLLPLPLRPTSILPSNDLLDSSLTLRVPLVLIMTISLLIRVRAGLLALQASRLQSVICLSSRLRVLSFKRGK